MARQSKTQSNVIIGAMVARPYRHDKFHGLRTTYNYTKPTLASNARLIAALGSLDLVFFWSGANYGWKLASYEGFGCSS